MKPKDFLRSVILIIALFAFGISSGVTSDPYRILARERSHEDARQTVATNRMLVQSLVILNDGAATVLQL